MSSGEPVTVTGLEKLTRIQSLEPAARTPDGYGELTLTTLATEPVAVGCAEPSVVGADSIVRPLWV